jgi:UDP-2-acetamido-3-amino-2,3-dideoxy-glucuronate N-acetyltransferase
MNSYFIHPLSDVQSTKIGECTRVWQFVIILGGASIGSNCNICSHCLIESDVVIGNNTTLKSGVHLWDGMRVGNNVFIGPNVTFTNDKRPVSGNSNFVCATTWVEDGASIGAGSTILPGVRIGSNSLIGAGSLVTKDVPANSLVYGHPAVIVDRY